MNKTLSPIRKLLVACFFSYIYSIIKAFTPILEQNLIKKIQIDLSATPRNYCASMNNTVAKKKNPQQNQLMTNSQPSFEIIKYLELILG